MSKNPSQPNYKNQLNHQCNGRGIMLRITFGLVKEALCATYYGYFLKPNKPSAVAETMDLKHRSGLGPQLESTLSWVPI